MLFAVGGFASGAELRVSAAASLAEAIRTIAAKFEDATGTGVRVNLGGSNVLARQIEAGAPVDVFISADEATMDALRRKKLVDAATIRGVAGNSLVVIVPADGGSSLTSAADLASGKVRRLALGDPAAVPAGVYARRWLESTGYWQAVRPKVVGTENVRAALAAVEGADADAGVVYATDAAISKKVKVAFTVPAAEAPPVVYPAAVCAEASEPERAAEFVEFLAGPEAAAIFEKHGFTLPETAK